MTKLDCATVFVEQFFNEINPDEYNPPTYLPGRPLNPPEDDEDPSYTGHKLVYVNEMFEDGSGNVYRVIDILGNGTFSYVFKVQLMDHLSEFRALKIIKNLPQYRATGISEILIHNQLQKAPPHQGKKNVIMPLATFEIEGHVCMILPLLYRSLFEGINQSQPIIELLGSIRIIMTQLLEALSFIHLNGVTHCDLKPDNILFQGEQNHHICLIDFGSATTSPSGQGQYIQSRFYRSPEVILGLPYSSMIDLWGAGCVAAELYLDFAIFACECESDVIHTISALIGPFPGDLLQGANNWWKFYNISPNGFTLKMDPVEVLTTRHSYHAIFEQTGPITLEQLILEHKILMAPEEAQAVACFNNFVHMLLQPDPRIRLTADQALKHPFILDSLDYENWDPPEVTTPVLQYHLEPNPDRPPSAPNMSIDIASLL